MRSHNNVHLVPIAAQRAMCGKPREDIDPGAMTLIKEHAGCAVCFIEMAPTRAIRQARKDLTFMERWGTKPTLLKILRLRERFGVKLDDPRMEA